MRNSPRFEWQLLLAFSALIVGLAGACASVPARAPDCTIENLDDELARDVWLCAEGERQLVIRERYTGSDYEYNEFVQSYACVVAPLEVIPFSCREDRATGGACEAFVPSECL